MAADPTYQTKNYEAQGGEEWVVGGVLTILPGATVTGLAAVVQQTALADLTENGGVIGGTNDGDLPVLSDLGTTHIALSTSNTYTDAAVNTAVNTALDAVVAKLNAALEANRELAAKLNAALQKLRDAAVIAT